MVRAPLPRQRLVEVVLEPVPVAVDDAWLEAPLDGPASAVLTRADRRGRRSKIVE